MFGVFDLVLVFALVIVFDLLFVIEFEIVGPLVDRMAAESEYYRQKREAMLVCVCLSVSAFAWVVELQLLVGSLHSHLPNLAAVAVCSPLSVGL